MKNDSKQKMFLFFLLIFMSIAGTQAQTKIRVTPQWLPQAQFTGLYVAQKKGFYKEAGLDVQILHPTATHTALDMLTNGETDIITSQLIEAILFSEQHSPLINILQTSEHNSLMVISHEPIKKINQLEGKKVGRWKAGFSELAYALAASNGLQKIEWVPFHSNIALFISGAIDATLAMEYNEYFQILMSGTNISDRNLLFIRNHGFDIPEDGFYTKAEYAKKNKETLKDFAEATKKGWEWSRDPENQDEALEIVMQVLKENNIHNNRVNQRYMMRVILKLQENSESIAPYYLQKERFEETEQMLIKFGFLKKGSLYESFTLTY